MKLKYYFNRKGLILVQQFSKNELEKHYEISQKCNYGCHQREVHVGLPTLEIKQLFEIYLKFLIRNYLKKGFI